MNDHELTLDVREAGVTVGGELDVATAPKLSQALELFVGRTVQLDMAAVTFCDSMGISALLRAKSNDIDVVIVDPSAAVRHVLEMVGLTKFFGLE